MAFKSILAVLRVGQAENDLEAAVELALESNVHLSVVAVLICSPPPTFDQPSTVPLFWVEEREKEARQLDEYVSRLSASLARKPVLHDVQRLHVESALASERLSERALYADLTIIGADLRRDLDLHRMAIDGCMFRSARPILFTPAEIDTSLKPRTVLLAWDCSLEAALAARAATDIMATAQAVHATLVDPQAIESASGQEPGVDIATYLARHGVNVIVDRLPSMGRPVADVLKQHAGDIGADMIVMGAYSHSRFRERLFGGVTQSMIEHCDVPVLMMH
ncbi:universal stress protein [Rhizobium sp. 32-5/1]|uniref:universal stress protein n=1 Tax=Rhizobium sp. 32-5/1 TaxID=3019602 RepID=UPI00240D2298|nr:universal stress protein [Rhizobium sp. 32-5/1]WEZ82135.1 universal stress protein [Rhizobium sp. 32-5/1]